MSNKKDQTTVYLENDVRNYLPREKAISGKTQKEVLNTAVRLYALAVNYDRLVSVFGADAADAISKVVESDEINQTIPLPVIRR